MQLSSLRATAIIFIWLGASGLVSCTVKLSNDTPGAKKSCSQSESDMNQFYCNAFQNVIIGKSCTSCHSAGSAGSGVMTFVIQPSSSLPASCCPNCYANNPAVVSANFCTAFLKGKKLVEYPQSEAHTAANLAQKFTASEIQDLIDWVNTQQSGD